jgi:Uma2 family endonuclease
MPTCLAAFAERSLHDASNRHRTLGLGDTVRSPDVAFVRAERLPADGIGSGWMTVAPDLVVEVLSPSETTSALDDKLRDYRAAGTRLFWLVDPSARTVSIRGDAAAHEHIAHEGDVLDGADVLPGFVLPVEQLFARLAKPI